MYKNFCLKKGHGITKPIVILLITCSIIISFIAGYFISIAVEFSSAAADPIISDEVRPGSVRALQQSNDINQ